MLQFKDVRFAFAEASAGGVRTGGFRFDLSLDLPARLAIMGPSGAGKSTLLNLLAGFERPSSGDIMLNGQSLLASEPAQRPVAMLFQSGNLFSHLTALENVALAFRPGWRLTAEQRERAAHWLEVVELADFADRLPDELSGGQQQRVALARALAQDRPLLALDEPFSALDDRLVEELTDLLVRLSDEQQRSMLMVTHSSDQAARFATQTLRIEGGEARFV